MAKKSKKTETAKAQETLEMLKGNAHNMSDEELKTLGDKLYFSKTPNKKIDDLRSEAWGIISKERHRRAKLKIDEDQKKEIERRRASRKEELKIGNRVIVSEIHYKEGKETKVFFEKGEPEPDYENSHTLEALLVKIILHMDREVYKLKRDSEELNSLKEAVNKLSRFFGPMMPFQGMDYFFRRN